MQFMVIIPRVTEADDVNKNGVLSIIFGPGATHQLGITHTKSKTVWKRYQTLTKNSEM